MATVTSPTVHSSSTTTTGPAGWNIWLLGLVAGAAATVAVVAVAAIALGIGVPMEAGPASAPGPEQIPLAGFASITIPACLIGTVLAAALARWSKRPVTTFLIVTLVLTAATFALPHTTHYATAATIAVLDLTHVVAAAIFIPAMAWRLAKVPARA
jgi:hypothetical protein